MQTPSLQRTADTRIPAARVSPAPLLFDHDWTPSIVPRPRSLTALRGAYLWHAAARISARTVDERAVAFFLRDYLRTRAVRATVLRSQPGAVDITLHIIAAGERTHRTFASGEFAHGQRVNDSGTRCRSDERALGPEGYRLQVTRRGVTIVAEQRAGLFYGVQTLEQITRSLPGARLATRRVEIIDWPEYRWRGIHLDVSRHFFAPDVIERYLDVAAHYKLNTFHWHLTDDRAWRIAIRRYPLLRSDADCVRGACEFYTQAQIRRIVAYASQLSVRIVPEIDVPGHSGAALRAYPAFACAGITRPHVLCPSDASVAFVKNILAEILALFPSRYVHIGGDEVDSDEWRNDPDVATLMRANHIGRYADVQSYFTERLARFLRSHHRRVVVWDDSVGAPSDATLMVWRPGVASRAAPRPTRDVVLTPDGPLYFDAYQGDPAQEPAAFGSVTTLEDVYRYNVRANSAGVALRHILGVQANLWTERIATPEHLFYMLLPRELALAEIAWTRPEAHNWASFERRLPPQFAWLAAHGYTFRIPSPTCTVAHHVVPAAGGKAETIALSAPLAANIRYTLDGSAPTAASQLYRKPVSTLRLRAASVPLQARVFTSDGRSTTTVCSVAGR